MPAEPPSPAPGCGQDALEAKLAHLQRIIAATEGTLVAFSGGVDSTLLLAAAAAVLPPSRLLAVTATGEIYPPGEADAARRLAESLGVTHLVVSTDFLADPALASNPRDRCYRCKRRLLDRLWAIARQRGLPVVADGSQADDLAGGRPGVRALQEAGVRSPLAEAGLGKSEVRQLSRLLNLPTWDQPARPCLATRFPYGTQLTSALVRRVAEAEQVLHGLGFPEVRVRDHAGLARLELPLLDLHRLVAQAPTLVPALLALGFRDVTLDLQGLRSGSMDLPPAEES